MSSEAGEWYYRYKYTKEKFLNSISNINHWKFYFMHSKLRYFVEDDESSTWSEVINK